MNGRFKRLTLRAGLIGIAGLGLMACGRKEASLSMAFPEDFNGKRVDLVSFDDSIVMASADITGSSAEFHLQEGDSLKWPLLAQIMVDGRVKGFYVVEEGAAEWCDTLSVAKGTPTNATFAAMLSRLEEAEESDDFATLASCAEKIYNENKESGLGSYFGVEFLKWSAPERVDSMLKAAPEKFKTSKRASRYIKYAQLRAKTAPGQKYADFGGKDAAGNDVTLGKYIEPGKYTLVDFMASWCPYCIKDMPELKAMRGRYAEKGFGIVSVAVRDTPEATAGAVEKHGIDWNVVYDAQKRPYDLYGFSGIPHYMLIGPDGKTIVARSGSLKDISAMLPGLLEKK